MANGDKRKARKAAKAAAKAMSGEAAGEIASSMAAGAVLGGAAVGGSLKRNRSLRKAMQEGAHEGMHSPLHANGGPGDKKKTSVAGQDITESGHMDVNYQDGPSEGDLIRGEHIKYGPEGLPMDYDYNIEFQKDTSDVNGPYKIWKTTGIK
jgi:hypothetical protein